MTENEDAVFEVRVSGHPSPDVTWYQGHTVLTPSDRVKIESDGDVRRLVLGKCQLEDAGKFRIVASNKAEEERGEATLIVKGTQTFRYNNMLKWNLHSSLIFILSTFFLRQCLRCLQLFLSQMTYK